MENNQNKILVLIQDLGVLYPKSTSKQRKHYAMYRCICGNEFKTEIAKVKTNHTKSCGCLKAIHNKRNHRLYHTWRNMMARCNNKNNPKYTYYGERGIKVCDEWLDIHNFINDMYNSYKDGLTLDRIDTNGNYCKSNCRWVDRATQSQNTRLIHKTNTTGYRGVYPYKNKYIASISVNRKKIHLGTFIYKISAAKAYNDYIILNNLNHPLNSI